MDWKKAKVELLQHEGRCVRVPTFVRKLIEPPSARLSPPGQAIAPARLAAASNSTSAIKEGRGKASRCRPARTCTGRGDQHLRRQGLLSVGEETGAATSQALPDMPSPVLCTCSDCIDNSFVHNGVHRRGRPISTSQARIHRRRDIANGLATPAPEVAPEAADLLKPIREKSAPAIGTSKPVQEEQFGREGSGVGSGKRAGDEGVPREGSRRRQQHDGSAEDVIGLDDGPSKTDGASSSSYRADQTDTAPPAQAAARRTDGGDTHTGSTEQGRGQGGKKAQREAAIGGDEGECSAAGPG